MKKGEIRVAWHPEGSVEVIEEQYVSDGCSLFFSLLSHCFDCFFFFFVCRLRNFCICFVNVKPPFALSTKKNCRRKIEK